MSQPIPEYQLESLLQGLASDEAKRREATAQSIEKGKFYDEQIVSGLDTLAVSDPYAYVRSAAASALTALGQMAPTPARVPTYPMSTQRQLSVLGQALNRAPAKYFLVGFFILYVAACVLPVYYVYGEGTPGYEVLLLGWIAIGIGQIAWFANPILGLCWVFIFLQKWRFAAVTSLLAFIIGLDTLTLKEIPGDDFNPTVSGYGSGMYVWLASIVLTIIAVAFCYLWSRRYSNRL